MGGPGVVVDGGVVVDRGLTVPLPDGTPLAADVYRPAGDGTVPVLVSFYPYRKDDIIGSLFHGTRIRLAERGYATVFADMAGTGASGGDYGESFDLAREGRDAARVIEWAAGQDWCDGTAGAWGVSYGGMTALAAAAQHPGHLRAIIAVYATTDIYRDTIAPGGCPAMLGRYAWAAHMLALGLCPPTQPDEDGRWRRVWTERLDRLTAGPSHAAVWQAHPDRDAYWQDRVVDAAAVDVPAMLVGGWADMFKTAMTSLYGALAGPKRLVMGPWMHVLPHLSPVEPWDWVGEMADWWDVHLRGKPAAGTAPVRFFAAGQGWRSAPDWPAARGRAAAAVPGRDGAGHGAATGGWVPRLRRRRRGGRGCGHVGPVRHRERLAAGAERRRCPQPDLHQRAAAGPGADRGLPGGAAVADPGGGPAGPAGCPAGRGRPGRPVHADHHRLGPAARGRHG